MEAAVRAVLKQEPGFPTRDIDIVTCASALGNLLRFVCGIEKDFRIILASVGTTVFLLRRENSPTTLIPDVRGYGHTFPEEYTTWESEVKNSVSHQRIIQYRFGGFNLLVRFEVDGYEPREDVTEALEPRVPDENKLISSLSTASIFEIKTRSVGKRDRHEIDIQDFIPRLWVSQISRLVLAYHDQGLFDENISIRDMGPDITEWEAKNAAELSGLASLLNELVQISRDSETSLEICRSGTGPLEIRRLAIDGVEAPPSRLREAWAGMRQPEGEDL
ncbi:hypothetical protein DV735_g4934, partial [Chaetothyriales sp. CBS 134920]